MSGRHSCAGTPCGIALVEGAGGWRVRFERAGSEWAREVTHCPWCGRRLGAPREGADEKRRRGGMRRASPVRCVETGEVFETQTAAALAVGTTRQSVCSSLRDGHRAGGFHWERLEEDARELDISLDGENTSDYPRMSCVRDLVRLCRALAERERGE